MTLGYCSQNEDGSPSEEQSQDSLLELVRQMRTVDWIRQADCYLQLKKILLIERFLLSCHDHGKTKTNPDFTIRCSNTELLRQDSYPFSETNFKDLSATRINFSRTPNFTLYPFIPEISKSVNSSQQIFLITQILKILFLELSRFLGLSWAFSLFPGLSIPGKCQNKIP